MADILIVQPFANSGDKVIPPQTDPSGFVNFQTGYTEDYEIDLTSGNPLAKAVERNIQNGLFNWLSTNQQMWQRLGFAAWHGDMPGGYDVNAQVVRQDGTGIWRPYQSKVANNVSDPLTTPTAWQYTPSAEEALANIPMPSGGPSGSSGLKVIAATNFNSFTTGTWLFNSDAVAVGSPNAPSPPGGATTAGMLESIQWTNGTDTFVVQRYTDRLKNSFSRGALNGVWTAWSSGTAAPTYSADTSTTVNLVSATFPLPSASIPDNSQFWVKINNTNTGAVTFTPNPSIIGALPVLGLGGLPLQGNEIVVNGRAQFIYKADTNNFVLAYCTGAPIQVADATRSKQATNLGQVNAAIQSAASPALLYYFGQL
jgi:hypothetical protein